MTKFYSRETIDQLLSSVTFQQVLDYYSIPTRGRGKNLGATCPKCGKDHDHFKINTYKNLANCFVCDFKGNQIQFVRQMENKGFIDAVERLAGIVDFKLPEENKPGKKSFSVTDRILFHAAQFYQTLSTDYPMSRGISKEVCESYQVGFAPGGTALNVHLLTKGFSQEQLLESGLVVERYGKMKDFFYECVIFPIKMNGKIVDFYGRHVGNSQVKHMYLIGEFMVYNLDNLDVNKQVVYVESIINALSLISAGHSNVVAVGGAKKFSDRHAKQLKSKGVRFLINGFDTGDASGAGQEGAIAAGKLIEGEKMGHAIMQMPANTDLNELLLTEGFDAFLEIAANSKSTKEYELRYSLKDVPVSWILDYLKERV